MRIFKGTLDKQALLAVPERERRLFLACAHFQNELNILHRAVVWSSDFTSNNEAMRSGQLAMTLFYVRLMAGKLHEAWKAFGKLMFSSPETIALQASLSPRGREALKRLKKYFGGRNLIAGIRNDFAFHFTPEALEDQLRKTEEPLSLYVENKTGVNTLVYFAEVLATFAISDRADSRGLEMGLDAVVREVGEIGGEFVSLSDSLLHVLLTRFGAEVWQGAASEVELPPLKQFDSVEMPWFVDTSDMK